jgi:hypothetical protein
MASVDSPANPASPCAEARAFRAALLHVDVGTLRNWEQGRREPTGPAKALLAAIRKDPVHVLKALAV